VIIQFKTGCSPAPVHWIALLASLAEHEPSADLTDKYQQVAQTVKNHRYQNSLAFQGSPRKIRRSG
jgi:hypothetical protein